MSFSKIIFEYPNGWVDCNSDPIANSHISCLETIRAAAIELNIVFETKKSIRMGDFAQRYAPDETLLISVHSIGVANNVVRLKESYLPGLYYFDRSGYSGWAELAYNVDLQNQASCYDLRDANEFVEKIKYEKLRTNSSKYIQPISEGGIIQLQDERPYILLALQTSDDLVACLATVNQLVLAEALAEKVCELDLNLVIKRHPMCRDTIVGSTIDRLKRKYRCVRISEDSINCLIVGAKAVVTVNSGVGFEALVMGVPVITAGRSDYSFVTRSIYKIEDLIDLTSMIVGGDIVKTCSVIKYYIEQYCFTCGDVEKTKKLLLKWQATEYSVMQNMQGYEEKVLHDAQVYVANLENMRRTKLNHRPKTLPDYRFIELISAIGSRIKRKNFSVL